MDLGERWALVVLRMEDGTPHEVAVHGDGSPDLAFVDALARLQLLARRAGVKVHLSDMCTALEELLELSGLRRQVAGQAEVAEQPVCVEEGMDPGDPVA